MKVTSKHYKVGTRIVAKCDYSGDSDGKLSKGDTGTICGIWPDFPGGPIVGFRRDSGDTFLNVPVHMVKRIKPAKPSLAINPGSTDPAHLYTPAESTVPEGCPVDDRCHREMTDAGWKWAGGPLGAWYVKNNLRLDVSYGLKVCDEFAIGTSVDDIVQGVASIKAWRKRSKS